MKITIAKALPSKIVSNKDITNLIRNKSLSFEGSIDKTLRKIEALLRISGSNTRTWLADNEKPIDLIIKCCEEALQKENLGKNDIDLLMYVGIGKGFAEPAQSYFVAKALGMNKVKCFDITDACMSWAVAVQMADSLLKTGVYKKIMIVNGEFIVNGGSLIKNFNLKNENNLNCIFPTYTIGEAATCTILEADDKEYSCKFVSENSLADLCNIPTEEYKGYCLETDKIARNGALHFTSYGAEMHEKGIGYLVSIIKNDNFNPKIIFTHASSKTMWHKCAEIAGVADKTYHISDKTGNLISASIPVAISMAEEEGKLQRGDKITFWVGTAGMCFNLTNLIF